MDQQENIEIPVIYLNDYANSLKFGETVVITRLENGNLNIITHDEAVEKLEKLIKYIDKIFKFNSYDECGEFKDNNVWNMKLD